MFGNSCKIFHCGYVDGSVLNEIKFFFTLGIKALLVFGGLNMMKTRLDRQGQMTSMGIL